MTPYGRILLAGLGSALVLLGALGFQYLGGLQPCPLCIWQRWPHAVAVALAALAVTLLWRRHRWLAGLGGATMTVSAGLALYHTGIERGWWQGPDTCSAPTPDAVTPAQLLDEILATPPVRCDDVPWEMLGLSMASWNGIVSLALAALWIWTAATPPPRAPAQASSSASQ